MAPLVNRLILDYSSGHGPGVVGLSPVLGSSLSTESAGDSLLSLPLPQPVSFSLRLKTKSKTSVPGAPSMGTHLCTPAESEFHTRWWQSDSLGPFVRISVHGPGFRCSGRSPPHGQHLNHMGSGACGCRGRAPGSARGGGRSAESSRRGQQGLQELVRQQSQVMGAER